MEEVNKLFIHEYNEHLKKKFKLNQESEQRLDSSLEEAKLYLQTDKFKDEVIKNIKLDYGGFSIVISTPNIIISQDESDSFNSKFNKFLSELSNKTIAYSARLDLAQIILTKKFYTIILDIRLN